MIGKPITDFVHNADHGELAKQFNKTPNTGNLAITEHEGKNHSKDVAEVIAELANDMIDFMTNA